MRTDYLHTLQVSRSACEVLEAEPPCHGRGRAVRMLRHPACGCALVLMMALVLSSLPTARGEDFQMAPVNQATVAGEAVLFKCQPKNGIINDFEWYQGDKLITVGDSVRPKYKDRVDLFAVDANNTYNIRMNSIVYPGDASQFQCMGGPQERFAQLIVMKDKPMCNSSVELTDLVEGEPFTVSCKASYKSRWEAQVTCEDGNSQEVPTDKSSSEPGHLRAFFQVLATNRSEEGQRYKCVISFPTPPEGVLPDDTPSVKYNRDAPSYQFQYVTDAVNVQFPVENLRMPGLGQNYQPGEQIVCEAGGRPEPTVRWSQVHSSGVDETSRAVRSSVLRIVNSMEGMNEYMCECRNAIRGVSYNITKTVNFTVTIPTTQSTTTSTSAAMTTVTTEAPRITTPPSTELTGGAIAGIVIGSIIGLLIIAAIVFLLVRRSIFLSEKSSDKKMKKPLPVPPRDHVTTRAQVHVTGTGQLPPQRLPALHVDNLQCYLEDNTAGSRKPLPAKEFSALASPQNNWI